MMPETKNQRHAQPFNPILRVRLLAARMTARRTPGSSRCVVGSLPVPTAEDALPPGMREPSIAMKAT